MIFDETTVESQRHFRSTLKSASQYGTYFGDLLLEASKAWELIPIDVKISEPRPYKSNVDKYLLIYDFIEKNRLTFYTSRHIPRINYNYLPKDYLCIIWHYLVRRCNKLLDSTAVIIK